MSDLSASGLLTPELISSANVAVCGQVERVIFQKQEDDYYIFTMRMTGVTGSVKIKGYAIDLSPGMQVDCVGKWEPNPKFGDTFNASNISEFIPSTSEGIRKLLHNGFVRDLSKSNADDLVNWFGRKLFDIAESNPDKLREVAGISSKRLLDLSRTVKEKRAIPRIMSYLTEVGLSRSMAHKVFKEFGSNAISIINANPYELTKIPKIRFLDADRVARQLGADKNSTPRIIASMEATLIKVGERGSTAMLKSDLLSGMMELLSSDGVSIDGARVEVILHAELKKGDLALLRMINGVEYVSATEQYLAEQRIARAVLRLHSSVSAKKIKSSQMSSQRFSHLDRDQIAAARMSLDSNFSIITGRPGCGKTTVTKSIVEVLNDSGLKVVLCAPTGRAAKRIKEATGFTGSTIHRLLGSRGPDGFEFNSENPLPCDAIILDEASMLSTSLMDSFMQAVAPGTKVILVGDKDQLASIDAGNVLSDLIRSATVSTYTLTEPHRFAKNSAIVTNSHLVVGGLPPVRGNNPDFYLQDTKDDKELLEVIVAEYRACLTKGFKREDIQILTPMRKVSELSSNNLNRILKEIINPGTPSNSITRNRFGESMTFSEGDRVMQCTNNYELNVFNGDVGYIKSISKGRVSIDFSGDLVDLAKADLDDLDLAYASTIHKSQGCEYKAVILPICKSHAGMLDRNLFYTALTRGKKHVSVVGDLWMMKRVCEKTNSAKRITGLEQCLWEEFDQYRANSKLRRVSAVDSSYSLN